jgi:hypothetical protein
MDKMILLQNAIRLENSNSASALITACEIMGPPRPTLFGKEFTFVFRVEPFEYKQNPLTLTRLKITISLLENDQSLMIGRFTSRSDHPHLLNAKCVDIQLQLHLRTDELIVLADRTHHGDVSFKFDVVTHFGEDIFPSSSGTFVVPHSRWLEILNGLRLDRYELIVIRTPVEASHLRSPFSEALNKIREAEREFSKGNWNRVGVACRSAWNTVLSSVPSGTPRDQRLEYLLSNVMGDPRRQKFAFAVLKGFNNVVNEAVHLEGDLKSSRVPSDLTRADALLCLHWYSTAIGYLASIASPSANATP